MGRFNGGFFALRVWGAYHLEGLIFGILQYYVPKLKNKKERKIKIIVGKLKQTNKRMRNTNQGKKVKRGFDFNCQFRLLIYVFSHNQVSGPPVSLQSNQVLTCNLSLSKQEQHSLTRRLYHDLSNGVKLSLYQGDITDEHVDAIVNAANERLLHGAGGVAAAIVQKGGRLIQEESTRKIKQHGPLNVGEATFTNESLQRRVNEKRQGERSATLTKRDTSSRLDFLTSDASNVADFEVLVVEPRAMQLLNRIYTHKLQEIEENFFVKIDWDESTSQVHIFRRSLPDRESRLDEGFSAFIDLYREFYPDKLGRDEVQLPKDVDERLLRSIRLSMAKDPIIIERTDNKLLVYAEKSSIRKFVQSLKKKLGIISDRSSKRNRPGEDNK